MTSSNIDEMIGVPPTRRPGPGDGHHHGQPPHQVLDLDAHGYSVLTVTPSAAQMDWYFLYDKTDPRSGQYHARSYRVLSGTQRVQPVSNPAG